MITDQWSCFDEIVRCRCEREAVHEIQASIAQREQLGLQQIRATEDGQPQSLAFERDSDTGLPAVWKDVAQLSRPVVEPIVVELISSGTLGGGERNCRVDDGLRQRRVQDVAISGLSIGDAQ